MVLKFPGGVHIPMEKQFADSEIKNINTCSAVCIFAGTDYKLVAQADTAVEAGQLLGFADGTPVYASIAGRFGGVLEIENRMYFVVVGDQTEKTVTLYQPEVRGVTELSKEDIIFAARQFGIVDPRSGRPLWQLLSEINNCTRVVIDCTEPFPCSSAVERICTQFPRSLVYGSKILLQATGGLKCVFAMEQGKKGVVDALKGFANDDKLFASAFLEEKYPYTDKALVYALYVKNLDRNETPADKGIFIVSAEAAIALFDAMATGMPQIYRYISVCGQGVNGGNLRVPKGITLHDLSALCDGLDPNKLIIKNSLLSGSPLRGALEDDTLAIISAEPQKKQRSDCISCGECAKACPALLFPAEILLGKSKRMQSRCIGCGACEYICPSGIPLMALINQKEGENG